MWIKILLSIAATGLSAYIGYRAGAIHKRRERYYNGLTALCAAIRTDIEFGHKKLHVILSERAMTAPKELAQNLLEYASHLSQSIPKSISNNDLKDDERSDVLNFFCCLGTSDVSQQLFYIDSYKQKFESKHTECTEKCKKLNGMHLKLGISAGLLISLLII